LNVLSGIVFLSLPALLTSTGADGTEDRAETVRISPPKLATWRPRRARSRTRMCAKIMNTSKNNYDNGNNNLTNLSDTTKKNNKREFA